MRNWPWEGQPNPLCHREQRLEKVLGFGVVTPVICVTAGGVNLIPLLPEVQGRRAHAFGLPPLLSVPPAKPIPDRLWNPARVQHALGVTKIVQSEESQPCQ